MQGDVVVPVYRDVAMTQACLESVLGESGPALRTLVVVNDCSPEPRMEAALQALRLREDRVRLLRTETNSGFVTAANLGLAACEGDTVVLNSDTLVTRGWLSEMLDSLASDPRVAALSPLSNNATFCSVPVFGTGVPVEAIDVRRLELSRLPRLTVMPTAQGFCLLMRREVLNTLGFFDPAYGRGYNEENDWAQRARAAGFLVARANRAFVFHRGEASFRGERARLDVVNARRLVRRYPGFLADCRAFEASPEALEAAEMVRAQLEG